MSNKTFEETMNELENLVNHVIYENVRLREDKKQLSRLCIVISSLWMIEEILSYFFI